MPTYKKCPLEIHTMANGLLKEFQSHGPVLDAGVRVDLVFAYCDRDEETQEPLNDAITHQGQKALGLCRIMPLKDRVMGRGDAEILLDGDYWHGTADNEMQRALLDHELHHISLKTVKGQLQYDAHGRPKLKMRKHDVQVGWFALIAERHGKNSQEQIQAEIIMDGLGQYFWPALAPNHISKQLPDGKGKLDDTTVTISGAGKSVTMSGKEFSDVAKKMGQKK